jgi:hypothetical protein
MVATKRRGGAPLCASFRGDGFTPWGLEAILSCLAGVTLNAGCRLEAYFKQQRAARP